MMTDLEGLHVAQVVDDSQCAALGECIICFEPCNNLMQFGDCECVCKRGESDDKHAGRSQKYTMLVHLECLASWHSVHSDCPLCRTPLLTASLTVPHVLSELELRAQPASGQGSAAPEARLTFEDNEAHPGCTCCCFNVHVDDSDSDDSVGRHCLHCCTRFCGHDCTWCI